MDIEPKNQDELDREKELRDLKKAKTTTFIVGVIGVYFLYLTLVNFKGKWTGTFADMPKKTLAMCAAFLVVGIVLVVFAVRSNKSARRLEKKLWEDAHPGESYEEALKANNQRSLRNPRASAAAMPQQSNKMSDRLAQLKKLNEMADNEDEYEDEYSDNTSNDEFSYEPVSSDEGADVY